VSALRRWAAEYARANKAPELEEALDVAVFRPLAFVATKALERTPITPNQVSVASLAFGLAAGALFWAGGASSAALAAASFFACNVLDCADGQLARLRGTPSPFGYIVDGSIDYLASVAVFTGMAHGLVASGRMDARAWLLAAEAGLSFGWQCAILDRKRIEWSHRVLGRRRDPAEERAWFVATLSRHRRAGTNLVERALIRAYLAYHAVWDRLTPPSGEAPRFVADPTWADRHRVVLRLATWMGPTTHMSLVMLAGVLDRTSLYLWTAIAIGNAWALVVLVAQRWAAAGEPKLQEASR
jgi:phosphatidylglycerophosphate synthase